MSTSSIVADLVTDDTTINSVSNAIQDLLDIDLSHLPTWFAKPFANLALDTGMPVDQILFLSCLFSSVLFGWAHQFVPTAFLRHLTNILLGAGFCYTILGISSIHMFIMSSIIYVYVNISLAMVRNSFLPKLLKEYDTELHTLSNSTENTISINDKIDLQKKYYDQYRSKLSSIGYTVFGVSMVYMSFSHIYRMYVDYMGWSVDFTAPLMVLTLKTVSYAWNRVDGELQFAFPLVSLDSYPKEAEYRRQRAIYSSSADELYVKATYKAYITESSLENVIENATENTTEISQSDSSTSDISSRKNKTTTSVIASKASTTHVTTNSRKTKSSILSFLQLDSLLNYYGWVYFFPGLMAGPMIEHNEYSGHISHDLYKHRFGLDKPVFSISAPLLKILKAFSMYPAILLVSYFPVAGYVSTPKFYLDYPSVFVRFLYSNFIPSISKYKYYFIWFFAEAACVSSGIGLSKYQPEKNIIEWDACSNCNFIKCEFPSTIAEFANNWNIRVSLWLKHTIYLRIVDSPKIFGKKIPISSFANVCTKMTSAFWHGFYPGYYLFFFQAWFVQEAEVLMRSMTLPLMETYFPKKVLVEKAEILETSDGLSPSSSTATATATTTTTTAVVAVKAKAIIPRLDAIAVIEVASKKPKENNIAELPAKIHDFFMRVIILMSMNYSGSSFFLLGWRQAIELYADVYFAYHIYVVLGLAFVLPRLRKNAKAKAKKLAAVTAVLPLASVTTTANVAAAQH